MFPFLRRNTPAAAVEEPGTGDEPDVLEVHQGWTDPIVQAVRGVGLPSDHLPHTGDLVGYVDTRPTERFVHRPSVQSSKLPPTHHHSQSYASLPAAATAVSSSSAAAQTPPPPTTNMYLARAPPPQKQPSGWLSYVFGTSVPGLTNAENGTEDDEKRDPAAAAAENQGEKQQSHRPSFATAESGIVPGSFPVPVSGATEKATIRSEATVRDTEKRRPKDEPPGELSRGGGKLGSAPTPAVTMTTTADPTMAVTTAKTGNPVPAIVRPSTLVLPSTYIKSTPGATTSKPTTTTNMTGNVVSKSYLNTSTKPLAQHQPTTFAATLASPPVITGTPAYGLSSARGKDGLTEAERVRKEWMDAQKEQRRAKRREERRAVVGGRVRGDGAEGQSEPVSMVGPLATTAVTAAAVTEELAGGGAGMKESADVPPSMGLEERPRRRKKKIRNRDAQQVAEGEGTEEAETRIQRIIIPQPLIVPSTGTSGPSATATHVKRSVEQQGQQQEQARRVKRVKQSQRGVREDAAGGSNRPSDRANGGPIIDSNAAGGRSGAPNAGTGAATVHRHHSHLRDRAGGRDTRTTNLLRQASMRRRNVWDDLGDLSAGERAPPPAFGAAAAPAGASAVGRGLPGASPLAREVMQGGTEEGGDVSANGLVEGERLPVHPDMDPDDPPPPFPETEERGRSGTNEAEGIRVLPRSPPPSFEFAVAQFQVTTERRRASTSSSTSSGLSMVEYGPPTEMQSRVIEEREAWDRDINEGFNLEERLARAAQRAKRLERQLAPISNQDSGAQPVSANAVPASTNHESPLTAREPVSRFSKEEKGKGKAVEEEAPAANGLDALGAAEQEKTVESPHEVSTVKQMLVVDARDDETKPLEPEGKPSRSYIKQSAIRHPEPGDQPQQAMSSVINDLGRTESKAEPPAAAPSTPAVLASPVSVTERPLPALPQAQEPSRSPQPLFSRKFSAGRESNPWKLLRKMSSTGATASSTDQNINSPLQSPSGVPQRRPSDVSGTDPITLSRTRSNAEERPKPLKRPSALSRMTSQLFKPNLGMDAGSSQADSGSSDRQNGQSVEQSPRIEDSTQLEEVLAESPVAEMPAMRYNDPPPRSPPHQGSPKPYIAQKHPFNRAVKPAWMQANQPIWQDPRAIIIKSQDATKPETVQPSDSLIQASTITHSAQAPVVDEPPPATRKEVSIGQGRPTAPSRLPPPPPVPIRNPLPPKQPVEGLPPPRLASKLDEEDSMTDIESTASDLSDSDSDSGSESTSTLSSSSSSSTSLSEVMAKRRVSTYRLLPPRGIPAEVLRSSEPPPPSRLKERRERPRPNGPRARDEPPPLPPRPSAPTIHEEPAEEEAETVEAEPIVVQPVPAVQNNLPTQVSPPSFPPRLVEKSPPAAPPRKLPEPETVSATKPLVNTPPPKPAPPPVPARKTHVRKPSNGKASVQSPVEPVKEATLQERIMASLLPEAPSHERAIPRALQDSIRASILPGGATEAPAQRSRPAAYRSLMSGTATPQTAPVFQTAQPKRKKTANPTGKLNIKPRFDDRPELELKSQLALRVNRWRMKEVPWTREEIEEELRRMNAQLEEDWPPQKVERTQSSPEIATKGMDSVRVGSGRIRDGQMRITSASTAESKEKGATNQPAMEAVPESQPPPARVMQAPLESPKSLAEPKPLTTAPASPGPSVPQTVNEQGSRQRSAIEPSQKSPSTRPRTQISPTIEYTDLDLAAARLEGTADEFEGIRDITSFVSETARRGATPTELSNLFIAPVEVESRRTTKEGKTKLKLSALGVRVLKCSVCLNNFRSGEIMAMMPKCGHVGHQKCVVDWLTRDARCMVCRESL